MRFPIYQDFMKFVMLRAIDSVAHTIAATAGWVVRSSSRAVPAPARVSVLLPGCRRGPTGCRRRQRGSSKGLVVGAADRRGPRSERSGCRSPADGIARPSMPRPRVRPERWLGAIVQSGGPRSSRPARRRPRRRERGRRRQAAVLAAPSQSLPEVSPRSILAGGFPAVTPIGSQGAART